MASVTPVRYAVVGLGHIAQIAVLPAFAHARRNSTLVAVTSDDRQNDVTWPSATASTTHSPMNSSTTA